MTLSFVLIRGSRPAVQNVSAARVVQEARNVGNPNAASALAVTLPILNIDQTSLYYSLDASRTQFRFQRGPLRLTLRQSIFMDRHLSDCARSIWEQHERGHVQDNQNLMGIQLTRAIRAHRHIQGVLVNPQWHPRGRFNLVQQRTETAISDVFRQLTTAAVRARDTYAEYRRVNRLVHSSCAEPYYYTVERGDTLSRIAKYFWGAARHWPSLYKANRRVVGSNPDLISPGMKLLIPKSP